MGTSLFAQHWWNETKAHGISPTVTCFVQSPPPHPPLPLSSSVKYLHWIKVLKNKPWCPTSSPVTHLLPEVTLNSPLPKQNENLDIQFFCLPALDGSQLLTAWNKSFAQNSLQLHLSPSCPTNHNACLWITDQTSFQHMIFSPSRNPFPSLLSASALLIFFF